MFHDFSIMNLCENKILIILRAIVKCIWDPFAFAKFPEEFISATLAYLFVADTS